MKIYNKTILTGLALSLSFGLFTSCDDDTDYQPGETVGGAQAYFPSSDPTQYSLTTNATSFSVVIARATDGESVTVPVTVTPNQNNTSNSAFNFPSSVSFGAGEKTANFVVNYDLSMIEYDDRQSFTLSIDDSSVTPYGMSSLEITAVYASPWNYLGEAQYTDYFVGTFFGVDDLTYEVEIEENALTPGLYRLKNPYGAAYPENEPGDWDTSQDYYLYVNAVNPDQVYICDNNGNAALFYSGMDWGYGEFIMTTFASYYLRNGNAASAEPYYGSMKNGVMYLAESSTLCAMVDYNNGGLYSRSFSGPATWVVLPGYATLDTDLELEYVGLLTTPTETQVIAEVTFGADVTSAKLAVVPASQESDAVADLQNGVLEGVTVTSSGEVRLPFDADNATTGKYSIVAVAYVDDEPMNSNSLSFTYIAPNTEDPNKGWTSLGMVDYTDAFMITFANIDAVTYEVEIQENDETQGLYRLVNPYGEAFPYNEPGDWNDALNSYLVIDATNPAQVYIPVCEQTLDWGYGNLSCSSLAYMYLMQGATPDQVAEEGVYGSLVNGKITFPVRTLLASMSGLGNGGWYYANAFYPDEDSEVPESVFMVDLNQISNSTRSTATRASIAKGGVKGNLNKADTKIKATSKVSKNLKSNAKFFVKG